MDVWREERAAYVRAMFGRVARHYDRLNRLVSLGQDSRWRRRVIDLARWPSGGRVLDVGAGTGDLLLEVLRRDRSAQAIGCDFTMEMMRRGRARPGGECIRWVGGDALELPFPDASFDAVVSGYLLRNVADVQRALGEQSRVLKPGGSVVCLDTTPPPADWRHWPMRLYLRAVVPLVGRILAGEAEPYAYLSESTARFLEADRLAAALRSAGFEDVRFARLMFGAMAIHWGTKRLPGNAPGGDCRSCTAGPVV